MSSNKGRAGANSLFSRRRNEVPGETGKVGNNIDIHNLKYNKTIPHAYIIFIILREVHEYLFYIGRLQDSQMVGVFQKETISFNELQTSTLVNTKSNLCGCLLKVIISIKVMYVHIFREMTELQR